MAELPLNEQLVVLNLIDSINAFGPKESSCSGKRSRPSLLDLRKKGGGPAVPTQTADVPQIIDLRRASRPDRRHRPPRGRSATPMDNERFRVAVCQVGALGRGRLPDNRKGR